MSSVNRRGPRRGGARHALACGLALTITPALAQDVEERAPAEDDPAAIVAEGEPARGALTEIASEGDSAAGAAAESAGQGESAGEARAEIVGEGESTDAALAEIVTETEPLPVTRFELQIQMEQFAEADDFAAAAALAEDLLTETEVEFGPESEILADTYVRVAQVQSRNREFEAAEQSALRAIDIYQAAGGPYSEQLIEPYLVLGDNFQSKRDFVSALSSYNEARTISRRVFGLLNEDQIEVIDKMTESAMGLNQFIEAEDLQRQALTLVERNYEPQSPEVLEAIYKYAAWLRRNNQFTAERAQYARADRIIREYYGDESLELVRPLRERANSWRTQGFQENIGISGLRNALEILEGHSEPLMTAEVYRDLGDWEAAFSKLGSNGEAYLQAWDLLGQLGNGDEIRASWFEPMTPVWLAPLSLRGLSTDPNAALGNVIVRFTVDTTGRTTDVVIVESNPPGLKDEAVERQIRQSKFRPMIRDGQLIRARRAYNIEFRYEAKD